MSCGCKTSGDSGHSCGTKANGCDSVDTCGNSYKLSVFDWLANVGSPGTKPENDFVEVRFKNDRKCFFRNINNLPLHVGSIITVESSPGHDVGVVSLTGELVKIQMKKKRFSESEALKVYRLANQKDIETWQDARKKEPAVQLEARRIAAALRLDMKISDVEFQGDGSKVTFYYTADNRVDFRQLIKEFASAFRAKIDMKQIGYRQEAAKVGGIGSCGRELCCSSWLTDFRSVNTSAARYQQLSISPQKLAGQCGKLKCCLNYELDSYLDALADFPASNATLDTEKGRAHCIKIDVFKRKMWFAYSDNSFGWYDLDSREVKKLIADNKKGIKTPPLEDMMAPPSVETKSVDLIQENNMDRFEKKRNNRNPANKNRNGNGGNTSIAEREPRQNRDRKPDNRNKSNGETRIQQQREPKPQQPREPRPANGRNPQNTEGRPPQNRNKKHFKKKPNKPDFPSNE